ncbi:hypothetical protein SAMN02745903_01998 [Pseudomonas sp. URMO17WK12:I5]|nr:hypothetical protein H040_02063 [Pseudomonas sp. URMO17WK12:I7]SMF19268.1 hypothetical protein SAMN02745903_01998 [Pseudomonas sp. URMO17WK12:I5]SNB79029.1 hypothetical protein SAMN02745900_03367 [Pseudomonas sp. URIL14HWK12:I8]
MSHLAETNGRSEAGEGDQAHGRGAEFAGTPKGYKCTPPQVQGYLSIIYTANGLALS